MDGLTWLGIGLVIGAVAVWLATRIKKPLPPPAPTVHTIHSEVIRDHRFKFNIDGKTYEFDDLDKAKQFMQDHGIALAVDGRGLESLENKITIDLNGKHFEFDSIEEIPDEIRKQLPAGLLENLK
jgi:hypothetical protein